MSIVGLVTASLVLAGLCVLAALTLAWTGLYPVRGITPAAKLAKMFPHLERTLTANATPIILLDLDDSVNHAGTLSRARILELCGLSGPAPAQVLAVRSASVAGRFALARAS